jgi:hypothetical protein
LLLIFNSNSNWIKNNGGLASWLQAIGSLYAIVAIYVPVFLERNLSIERARISTLSSAKMAVDLMDSVTRFAFSSDDSYSEYWIPQWHVIDEVMASCPIHEINSEAGLNAFVTIRELYGRMRAWEEDSEKPWPVNDVTMQTYVGNLYMNAKMQYDILKNAVQHV